MGGDVLASCAEAVVQRGLETPAIFFLEMYKPLTTLAHASIQVGAPFFIPLVGLTRYQQLLTLLSSRENIESLICMIERGARQADASR